LVIMKTFRNFGISFVYKKIKLCYQLIFYIENERFSN
jgi:hypothetical protein